MGWETSPSSAVDYAEGVALSGARSQSGRSFPVDKHRTVLGDGTSLSSHCTGMSTNFSFVLERRRGPFHRHVHTSSNSPLLLWMRFSSGFAFSRIRLLSPVSPDGWWKKRSHRCLPQCGEHEYLYTKTGHCCALKTFFGEPSMSLGRDLHSSLFHARTPTSSIM